MKLVVSRESLQKGLQVVQGIVESKSTMPILSHILLSAEDTTTISATDLDIAVREPLEARIEEPGSVCVPARKLYEIVREIPASELTLETQENNWVTVSAGKSTFRLIGLSDEDFPTFPEVNTGEAVEFPVSELHDMISRTLYATGDSDARYTLNGLMFHLNPEKGTVTFVGTDGHRLAVARKPIPGQIREERKMILPKKAATEVRKLTEAHESPVHLTLTPNHIVFRFEDILFITRLIEGSYPNYEQVIPKNNEKRMTVGRDDMLGAVKRASLVGREKTFPIKMELREGTATFSSNNPDVGEAHEQLAVDYGAEALTLGFNARYMVDALQNLPGEEIALELQDSLSPTVIRQAGEEGYFSVIMPMRI